MGMSVTYGMGGYCEDCNPEEHGHPMNNLISIETFPDPEVTENLTDVEEIAQALSALPQETLLALKTALGI